MSTLKTEFLRTESAKLSEPAAGRGKSVENFPAWQAVVAPARSAGNGSHKKKPLSPQRFSWNYEKIRKNA
jgi:hypothetical protein